MQNAPFTVKQVTSSGAEFFWPAAAVFAIPKDGFAPIDERIPVEGCCPIGEVQFDKADGSDVRGIIDFGTVYIMNQNGKTVQRYVLSE